MSHGLVSNRMLLICITVWAKLASISKVPKRLKDCISNTLCGRHTNLAQIYLEELSTQAKGYYDVAFCYSVTMATKMT